MPAPSPMVEASTPMTSASVSTEPIIWRRLPPIARSSASSFVRCATMIENVFRIRKMPTNSATPAKPRRMSLTNDSAVAKLVGLARAASCLPVLTDVAAAERGGDPVAQLRVGDAGGAA